MSNDSVVRARIDEKTKARASNALAKMGLTISDAIRLMLVRVAADKALPFEVVVPNAETRAAMRELENGKGRAVGSVDALMADLNAPD